MSDSGPDEPQHEPPGRGPGGPGGKHRGDPADGSDDTAVPGGGRRLDDIAAGDQRGTPLTRTTVVAAGVAALLGVGLVAAAPLITEWLGGPTRPSPSAEAEVTSPSAGSAEPEASPSPEPSGKDDAKDREKDPDDDAEDKKDGGPSTKDEDDRTEDRGGSDGPSDTDRGEDGGDGDGGGTDGGGTDGGTGDDGGDTDDGNSGGTGGDGSGTDPGTDDDPGSDTPDGDSGSGSGDSSGSGSGGSGWTTVASSRSVNLAPGCFPGSALDLDTLKAADTAANGQYEFELSGCAPNIQGSITTHGPAAVLGSGASRPGAAACAQSAKGGSPLVDETIDAGQGVCTTTGGGRIAFVSIRGYRNSGSAGMDGSLDAVVTTWRRS